MSQSLNSEITDKIVANYLQKRGFLDVNEVLSKQRLH
jgi:hypothetical protein